MTANTMTAVLCTASLARPGRRLLRNAGVLSAVLGAWLALGSVPALAVDFGIAPGSFTAGTFQADGSGALDTGATPDTQAGDHPYAATTSFALNTTTNSQGYTLPAGGDAKDVVVDLPPGFVGDPSATPHCQQAVLDQQAACPNDTVIGVIYLELSYTVFGGQDFPMYVPVYNMVPSRGEPALFAFYVSTTSLPVFIHIGVRTGGDYGVTATISNISDLATPIASTLTLWGVPADPSHDPYRGTAYIGNGCLDIQTGASTGSCPSDAPRRPLLDNPGDCSASQVTTIHIDSWQHPGRLNADGSPDLSGPSWSNATATAPKVTGCGALQFNPSITVRPDTTVADSPSGLAVDLHVPLAGLQNPDGLAAANLKKAVVTLPAGVSVNPSSANGLQGCSEAQIGLDNNSEPSCPDASKVGSVEVDTPLLPDPLKGAVYVAQQGNAGAAQGSNPFGSLLAIYVTAEADGVLVKLAGHVVPDPVTGQLTATFDNNPQLPFSDLKLDFFGGPRAALRTPSTCGTHTTTSVLTPWSAPYTPPVTSTDSFQITGGPNGSPCPAPQFKPTLHAGVTNPVAGSSSTFVLRVQRDDIDNEFKTISTTMPPGLLAKVAGVPLCSDAQATAGNCPAESQIGRVEVGAGAGTNPFYITNGKVYLTEGYKGGPFGLAISVPAVAGPFDLGTVNVRAALVIDPLTAQVTVVSDPMPRILQGIPLQVRDVRVIVDRPDFMRAPTNCDEMSVGATIGSYSDDSATVSNRFQVGECGNLAFAPKIAMGFTNRSQVHKRKKPGLDFKLSQKPGEANIKSVTVKLPRALVLDVNGASGALCEVAQAENGTCPASSIVGHASAATPLLDQPLAGAVYFVRGDNALPNIMVALRGAININLRSKSKVDKMGRLISTFNTVPDAPISQFHLTLGSAGRGVLSVAPDSDLCTGHNSKGKVSIAIVGQNGKSESLSLKIKTPCKKARKHKR